MTDTGRDISISNRKRVYHSIKERIVSLALKPGDIIHERVLAQELGVSRTPVREALQSLQDEGWLTIVARKGAIVRPISRFEAEEVLQMREIIAAAGITLSAGRAGPADFAYFHSLIDEQERAAKDGNHAAFMEADMALHTALVRLAGNSRLTSVAEDLLDNFRRLGLSTLRITNRFFEAVAEHKEIVAALEANEVDLAKQLMVEHIRHARKLFYKQSPGCEQ